MARKAKQKSLVVGPQYQDKYVAFASSGRRAIVASDSNLNTVIKKAQRKGENAPGIVFVPKKGATCLY